jgi:hypothetical protein
MMLAMCMELASFGGNQQDIVLLKYNENKRTCVFAYET